MLSAVFIRQGELGRRWYQLSIHIPAHFEERKRALGGIPLNKKSAHQATKSVRRFASKQTSRRLGRDYAEVNLMAMCQMVRFENALSCCERRYIEIMLQRREDTLNCQLIHAVL